MTREPFPGDPSGHDDPGGYAVPGGAALDNSIPAAALTATPVPTRATAPAPAPANTPPPLRFTARGRFAAWTAAVVFAAIAGRFAALCAPAEFAVLGSGLVVFAWATRIPADQRRAAPERIDGRGSLAWLGLLAVFLTWELFALFRGSTAAHPTLSILLGPILAEPLPRSGGYLLWLAAGVWIAKR